jgi:hypothetical protein
MSLTSPCPTYSGDELFNRLDRDLAGLLKSTESAQDGDICGFAMHTKSENSRHSYALHYPVEDFLVMTKDGSLAERPFNDLPEAQQQHAALIAMRANLLRATSMSCVSDVLHDLDDQEGALYANIYILPSVALMCRDMYKDFIEVSFDYPEDIEDEIARHFALLRRSHASQHETLKWHDIEQRALKLLAPLAPVEDEFHDPSAPCVALEFDTQ